MASDPIAAQRRVLEIAEALEGVPGLIFHGADLREFGGGAAGVDVDLWVREEFDGLGDGRDHDVDELQEEIDFLEDQLADARETLDECNEQLDEARRRANDAEQQVLELEDGADEEAADPEDGQEDGPPFDPMGKTPGNIEDRVAEIDDPESLRLLRESERTGSHRSPVAEIINSRVDELEDDDSTEEPDGDPAEPAPDLPDSLDDPPRALAEAMAALGESRVDDLADHLDVSKGTIHGRLSALREYDLVDARPAPDPGRAKLYSLATDVGEPEDDQEDGDDDPEDTVFAVTGSGSGEGKRYHEDEECQALKQANNYHEKPRDSVPHHEPCDTCAVDDVVYVTSGVTSPSPTYHEREDCPSVKKADAVREVDRDDLVNKEPCKRCAIDENDDEEEAEIPAECEWLGRPADVIVEDSSVERDLEEVLDVVDRADGWLQVHKRIAGKNTSTTKDLLWELGLREQSGALCEDDVLEERLAALREVYVDGEPVAADGGGGA